MKSIRLFLFTVFIKLDIYLKQFRKIYIYIFPCYKGRSVEIEEALFFSIQIGRHSGRTVTLINTTHRGENLGQSIELAPND